MATKQELEDELAAKDKQVAKLEKKLAAASEPQVETVEVEKIVEVAAPPALPPVESGQLYVESHPTLGVLRSAHVTSQSHGDGRIGDGAEIVRS